MKISLLVAVLSPLLIQSGCANSLGERKNVFLSASQGNTTTPSPDSGKLRVGRELKWVEYGLYSYVIGHLVFATDFEITPDDTLIIKDQTISPPNLDSTILPFTLEQKTRSDFLKKNSSPYDLEPLFDVHAKYKIATVLGADKSSLVIIKSKYPKANSILCLSRIGINQDRTQALVYLEAIDGKNEITKQFFILSLDKGEGVSVSNVDVIPVS